MSKVQKIRNNKLLKIILGNQMLFAYKQLNEKSTET